MPFHYRILSFEQYIEDDKFRNMGNMLLPREAESNRIEYKDCWQLIRINRLYERLTTILVISVGLYSSWHGGGY